MDGMTGYTIFDTAIGPCAIAWRGGRIARVATPSASTAALKARFARDFAHDAAPPPFVRAAIEGVVALLAGEKRDLSAVPLDMDGVEPFEARVYADILAVGPGATTSYGEIAARLGDPTLARAVGQALGRNPFPIIVPCHRVLAAGGRSGGFSAPGGVATKRRLLAIEAVHAPRDDDLFAAPRRPPG